MSIREHLNKIRNAIYGREVRESIAKGIETAYDDASENGNANMEVKIARGTHPNLRSRLEEVDDKQQQTTAQLAQTDGRVSEVIANAGDGTLPTELVDMRTVGDSTYTVAGDALRAIAEGEATDYIEVSKNLFDSDRVLLNTTISTTGEIEHDDVRWLQDHFVPVEAGELLSVTDSSYRVMYFDENFDFITRSGTLGNEIKVLSDERIKYMKLSGTTDLDTMMLNRGDELYDYQPYGVKRIKPEYLPELDSIDEQAVIDKVLRHVEEQYPSENDKEFITSEVETLMNTHLEHPKPDIPRLSFRTVDEGFRYVKWLSKDGKIVYGNYGTDLLQSDDEWETRVRVGTDLVPEGYSIGAIRELNDGELILSTTRDESIDLKAKIYKTIGYDRNNPSACEFKEVMEILAPQANVNNSWGMSVYDNIVTVSEYGLRDTGGARRVYLSQDHGETFELIFDQYTQVIAGRPPLTMTAHMHTATYDPYYNRIWVAVGDRPNTATYYSDDMGETWIFVEGSTAVQYTGIMPLPDAVLFGSDRSPNGLHVYHRNDKSKMPVIEPLYILNDQEAITHVFQLPFKRDWHPNTPTYFAATGAAGSDGRSVIMGTVNGKRAYMIYEADLTGEYSGHISYALGNTAQGNIIAEMTGPEITGSRTIVAKAPNWV